MRKNEITPLMVYAVRVAMAVLLAIGCFAGFSNDPTLSGFYWLLSAIWILFELT